MRTSCIEKQNPISILKDLDTPDFQKVYAIRLDPSVLAFSLSLHRHKYVCISFSSRFIYYNEQTKKSTLH